MIMFFMKVYRKFFYQSSEECVGEQGIVVLLNLVVFERNLEWVVEERDDKMLLRQD